MLWCCCLGIRKSIWPVKNWVMRHWSGSVSLVRHGSRHTSPSSWGILRPGWCCVELMQIIPRWSYPIHLLRQTVIRSDSIHLQHPTGFGPRTNFLSALHRRRSATNWEAQPTSTRIRGWQAGVGLLLTLILLGASWAGVCVPGWSLGMLNEYRLTG